MTVEAWERGFAEAKRIAAEAAATTGAQMYAAGFAQAIEMAAACAEARMRWTNVNEWVQLLDDIKALKPPQ